MAILKPITTKSEQEELSNGYSIIIETISEKLQHANYQRTVDLADLYKKLITGDKVDELLKQFVMREDQQLFNQRKLITQAITPSVAATIMNPFYKVGRVKAVVYNIDFEGNENADANKTNLKDAIAKFNGTKSLETYLNLRLVELNFSDPNSFIITEFDTPELGPQGELLTKVSPRPFEASSKQAINYFYDNDILQWLIVREDIIIESEKEEGADKSGYAYTIYLPNFAIKFTQICADDYIDNSPGKIVTIETPEGQVKIFKTEDDQLFLVEEFDPRTGVVPAYRVGYKRDLVTDSQTMVSPLHDAMPYFMKSIKTVSEFDLSMALHAFPQKFQYANRCDADGCKGGNNVEGSMCGTCKGSGLKLHTSAQDAIVLRLPPPDDRKDQMIDLAQMVHYERPPIDILQFQKDTIKELKEESYQAVFNSEAILKNVVSKTATEIGFNMDSIYDTLQPFAENYSTCWKYIVSIIAKLRDVPDAIVEHKFPKDFKLKTISDLLEELKNANDSGAPGYIKSQISLSIAEQQYIDQPDQIKRISMKQQFFPFPDKIPTEIAFIISNNLTTKRNKILWTHFDQIFSEIESEQTNSDVYLYDLAYDKLKALVDAKIDTYLQLVEADQPAISIPFNSQTNIAA